MILYSAMIRLSAVNQLVGLWYSLWRRMITVYRNRRFVCCGMHQLTNNKLLAEQVFAHVRRFLFGFTLTGWMTLPARSWYLPCFRLESLIRQAENRCRAGVLYRIIASDLKYCLTIDRKIICRRLLKSIFEKFFGKTYLKAVEFAFWSFSKLFRILFSRNFYANRSLRFFRKKIF